MLKSRPDREPNLTISDLRVDEVNEDDRISYTLAHDRALPKKEHEWIIPPCSTFNPPDFVVEGGSYAVWSEEIDVEYTTARGKKRTKKRKDWVWIEPLKQYEESVNKPTNLTKRILRQMAKDDLTEIKSKITHFEELFSRITDE